MSFCMEITIAEGIFQMRAKSDRKRTMTSATFIIDKTRERAAFLVSRRERECGSRMMAYQAIAAAIGATPGWLRKFVGRSPDVSPDFVTGFNIIRLYNQLCNCVEENIAKERALIAAHQERTNAVDLPDFGMAAFAPEAKANGARS